MRIKGFFVLLFCIGFGSGLCYGAEVVPEPQSAPFVVVLDAGHGGHDPGNLGNGYMEKNIALNIVLEVGKWLEKQQDIKVIYTRKDDSFVDLYLRGQIANEANADLFVSVHCDSHSSDAHGAGTFVLGLHANEQNFEIAKKENSVIYLEDNYETRYAEYDINSPESIIGLTIMQEEFLDQSIMLAKMMQDEFTGRLKRNDRKVKQAGFIVLHQTFMPSVLVETGFLTNKNEGSYLNSSRGQVEMGKAIADAIITYKQNVRAAVTMVASSTPSPTVAEKVTTKTEAPGKEAGEAIAGEVREELKEKEITLVKQEVATVQKEIKSPQTVAGEESNAPEPATGTGLETQKDLAMGTDIPVNPGLEITVKKENSEPENRETPDEGTIVFKVQLMASAKDLPLRPDDFRGLGNLSKEPYNNLYRYLYGNTNSYEEAKLLKTNADLKGYTTSFIVAYRNGVRLSMKEAMKYAGDK